MLHEELMSALAKAAHARPAQAVREDEQYIDVEPADLRKAAEFLHETLRTPVMSFFASDETAERGKYVLHCVFLGMEQRKWYILRAEIPGTEPRFASIALDMFSAQLFEREMREEFGIIPEGTPDSRRLRLHDEVWPKGAFPMRKSFVPGPIEKPEARYEFGRVEGLGIFEVPVGPVHAGVIGPGHFRFNVAGEPIINLEIRLGFTHRGIEKLAEGRTLDEALKLAQCVAGDTSAAYSAAYCMAAEKVLGIAPSPRTKALRALACELERMYNHVNDIGGIALDVGYSFAAMYAQTVKEELLRLNEAVTGSRYLKDYIVIGGVAAELGPDTARILREKTEEAIKDVIELERILLESVSFMDRADGTGTLRKKTAEDFGVTGLAARAAGIPMDLRETFPGIYSVTNYKIYCEPKGDVLARLKLRIHEFKASAAMVNKLAESHIGKGISTAKPQARGGYALGHAEAWRGPVLIWLKTGKDGRVERCKFTDPSFKNWLGLTYSVLGDIIPDFPLCNKSFDLSYSGNDL